ncbi:hypothetical protein EYF80_021564 [Liparis tanakae]|uniref:Secreted protein n=1 Tax=Liparis tanakae TaxID=230148 RepID=A0A4Z2HTP3_9TELE|nr:hypothetical protein EYF80_021564 [Liparis tanakae]
MAHLAAQLILELFFLRFLLSCELDLNMTPRRNWTVRDIPPSHEAISIMKPAEGKQIESVYPGWKSLHQTFRMFLKPIMAGSRAVMFPERTLSSTHRWKTTWTSDRLECRET